MQFRFVGRGRVAGLALAVVCLIPVHGAAQNAPTPSPTKKVPTGYGLDKDQPFAGADPNGTGLPWREPPPEAVEAAKKTEEEAVSIWQAYAKVMSSNAGDPRTISFTKLGWEAGGKI
jgi:hypothetical protein